VENKQEAETGSDLARLLDGEVVARLTKDAQKAGIPLSGEGGLLKQLTKMVLETALQGEMDAHLGYGKHEPAGRTGGNSRNGSRSKTVVTDVGPVQIEVPRDRDASFAPQIVAKRQRRLAGVDDLVISLTARGLTSGEICAHLPEVYGTRSCFRRCAGYVGVLLALRCGGSAVVTVRRSSASGRPPWLRQ